MHVRPSTFQRYGASVFGSAHILTSGAVPARADDQQTAEAQIGIQEYQILAKKGEIIERSASPRLYALLGPIATRLAFASD